MKHVDKIYLEINSLHKNYCCYFYNTNYSSIRGCSLNLVDADAEYFIYLRKSLLIAPSCYPGQQLTHHLLSVAEQVS